MKLFIGCSSQNSIPEYYLEDCNKYLSELLNKNDLVFGACPDGIMGISYNIAKENNNKVIGVCTEMYQDDLKRIKCDEAYTVKSVMDRTKKLIELSDALIFLPGGIGTIHELITAIELKRNNEFDKPIIIYNCHNFYDKLLAFLEVIYNNKFTSKSVKNCYYVTKSINDTINYLHNYKNII